MKSAVKFLGGSFTTYVLMAACSAASGGVAPVASGSGGQATRGGATGITGPDGGGDASVAQGGGVDAAQGGVSGSIMGMIMDPVPDASAEPATDGTRLKAEYLVGQDGSRHFLGWWDSQRSEECSFTTFADGMTRCVPGVFPQLRAFSDSGCSVALVGMSPAGCTSAKYAFQYSGGSGCASAFLGVEALTPVSPAKIYTGTTAACVEGNAAYLASYSFYSSTTVALSSFVSATIQHM
jgi:hypothetical protein